MVRRDNTAPCSGDRRRGRWTVSTGPLSFNVNKLAGRFSDVSWTGRSPNGEVVPRRTGKVSTTSGRRHRQIEQGRCVVIKSRATMRRRMGPSRFYILRSAYAGRPPGRLTFVNTRPGAFTDLGRRNSVCPQ